MSHSHLINHAAGWLEGGLSASLEKIVIDAEMLRGWAAILKPVEFGDDDLALDAIRAIAAGRPFLRLAAYARALRDRLLPPDPFRLVELRELARRRQKDATERAHDVWKKTREGYMRRRRSTKAMREALDDYVARRRIELGV